MPTDLLGYFFSPIIFLPTFQHPSSPASYRTTMGRPAEVKDSDPPRVYEKRRTISSVSAKYQIEVDSLLKTLLFTSASLIPSSSNSNSFPLKGLYNKEEKSQHSTTMQCEKSAETVTRGAFSKIVSCTTTTANRRRSVSFSLVEHNVRSIQRLEEFRDDIWLQKDDFKRIKKEAISSLRRIERGEATHDDAVKGLEVRISDNAACRNENRALGLRKVLREQDMQLRKGMCDVQAIASTYKEISWPCQLTAYLIGLEDQHESKLRNASSSII
jgi:hypothetical protein